MQKQNRIKTRCPLVLKFSCALRVFQVVFALFFLFEMFCTFKMNTFYQEDQQEDPMKIERKNF